MDVRITIASLLVRDLEQNVRITPPGTILKIACIHTQKIKKIRITVAELFCQH